MTRVAYLNEKMWTELFLENKENLLNEINTLIENLTLYKNTIENSDEQALTALLKEGKEKKEQLDK